MSRRKQAKPRPIFAYEDEGSHGNGEEFLVPLSQTNGHALSLEEDQEDQDDFEDFGPLVMDTSCHGAPPSSLPEMPHPQSPLSINSTHGLPITAQTIRPKPIKALNRPPMEPLAKIQIDNSNNIHNNNSNDSSFMRISSTTTSPMTPTYSNGSSCDGALASITTSALSSSEKSPVPSSSPSTSTATMSPSVVRRGSKNTDENDENLDYDSDFDDLQELLSELIRDKILPVAGEDGEKFICPVCNCSLLNLHDLTVHIRSHNTPTSGTQSNECKICGKILSSQSSLDRHMLVHSGERPFICKICNMSFTTNGNMHRHSRIHTKEESLNALGPKFPVRRGKSAWRQRINSFLNQNSSPVSDRMKSFQGGLPGADLLQTLPNHSQQSVFGRPAEAIAPVIPGMKRQFSGSDLSTEWAIPFKRQSVESENDVLSSPKKYSYHFPTQAEEPAKEVKAEEKEEPEKDDRGDKEVLHCPACPKTFLCKYGLETHLEIHPEYSTHCNLCKMTFKNARKLRLHHLIAHTESPKDSGEKKDVKEADEQDMKIGFQDLSFVDFSVEKFALIAKHYFEKNIRIPSSAYLNFICKLCSKAFPCESSLILHSYTHSKQNSTQCPLCDSDYGDVNEFHTHMLKHLSDKAFEEIRPSLRQEKGDDDLTPERLSKPDFLAMFELKEEEDLHHDKPQPSQVKKEASNTVKAEKTLNNDYFAKLGQAFAGGVQPVFGHFPLFPPGYQPTLDDFHKMLQIATKMNVLPSMGPGLLMQGVSVPSSAHSSPSKMASTVSPKTSTAHLSPVPAHIKHDGNLISKMSPEERRQQIAGPEKEINEIKMMNSGPFPCKYCDNVFATYKLLKVHVRSHLGLSPYQCNLCVYSSADKSSLIRHIRTHTGDRPFQCTRCDFAFTTRANCERHIRKKHQVTEREEVDKCLFHNKLDKVPSDANFHSPDTICKYCGIDFKYFRALKHHLRSHSSCSQKPFQCEICDMGFCTKANCLRHIQKMHPAITDNQIEKHIMVFSQTSAGDNDTDNDSVSDDGIPLYTEESQFGFDMRSENGTPQPPAAHSTPKPEGLRGRDSRHVSPNRHMSPMPSVSPSRSPLVIKSEPIDAADNAPLDFSMKPGESAAADQQKASGNMGKGEDAPMDLSVRKDAVFQPISSKQSSQKPTSIDSKVIQCSHCPMGYSNYGALERHVRQMHRSQPAAENTSLSSQLTNYSFINSDGKLLLPPRMLTSSIPKAVHQPRPIKPKTVSATIQNLQEKIKQNLKRDSVARSPSGSDSDLASVTKMIDATDPHNFQAFFNREPQTAISPSPTKKSATHLPNILRRPGVQISLEHCKAINRELDNLEREGDVDEVALSQVREMALSVKEECVNSNPISSTSTPRNLSPTSMQPEQSQSAEDENSGDGSSPPSKTGSSGTSEVDKSEGGPVKKKRNSYADSPHKLSCPYCPRAFPWVSSLTRHLLTHTGQKPFKCPRCPVTFSTKSNRERHLIRKHGVNMLDPLSRQTMDRPYKCPLCVFSSFSTQSNLLKHYKDRHNGMNLPDNIADIERMSPTAIRAATMEMESRAAENPPKLDENSMLNSTEEDEEEDLDNSLDSSEKNDEDSIQYTDIEASDDRADNVSEHSEKSTYSLPLMSDRPLVIADQDNYEKPKIAPHLLIAMPELQKMRNEIKEKENEKKEEEDRKTESPNTLSKNIQRIIAEQKAIIEQKAQMEMRMQAEIRAHIESQKKADEASLSPLSMEMTLEQQKRFTGSAERIINPERDNYDVDKITECWKCKDVFPSRKSLVRHLKEHNIDLPYKCYLCDASYDKRVECLVHQEDAHGSDWKILKDKNKVGDIDQFAIHMDKVVENNCNKLDSGSILEIPGTGSDDSKMEVISADYMQRKVYCSLCPKRFWSLQDLRRHMRSHTGERPFECDICQKRFTLKHSMMRHRKKHVGAPPRSFEDDEDSNGIEERSSRPSTSRNAPVSSSAVFFQNYGLGTNTFLFSQGLSGGRLTIGGSNIGSLISSTATATASSPSSTASGAELTESQAEPATKSETVTTIDSVKKEFLDCSADMLHNLLGVDSSAIEKMIDSADSKTAAKFLGVTEAS